MKKRRNNRLIALMLTMILLFSSVAGNAFALDLADAAMSEQTNTSIQEPISQDASLSGSGAQAQSEPYIVEEDVSKRGEFEKHYLCSDGKYIAVTYPEAIHYQDILGNWVDIDNSLVLDSKLGVYTTNNSKFKVSFSSLSSLGSDIIFLEKDNSNQISWDVSVKTNENLLESAELISTKILNNSAPTILQNNNSSTGKKIISDQSTFNLPKVISKINYNNIFGNTNKISVNYTVYHNKIEEDIIIEEKCDIENISLNMNVGSLIAVLNDDNSVDFVDYAGEVQYSVGIPYFVDSAHSVLNDITVSLSQDGEKCIIKYIPAEGWLEDESRVYPVMLDPSITSGDYNANIVDTYVVEGDTSAHYTEQQIYIGVKNGKIHRGYFHIENLPDIDESMPIITAILNVNVSSAPQTYGSFGVYECSYQWDEETLTYRNQPWIYESSLLGTTSYYSTAETYGFFLPNIGTMYHHGYTDTGTGYVIKQQDESTNGVYSAIYSSEYTVEADKPCFQIIYGYSLPGSIQNGDVITLKNFGTEAYLSVLNGTDAHSTAMSQSTDTTLSSKHQFKLEYDFSTGGYLLRAMCSSNGTNRVLGVAPGADSTVSTGDTVKLFDYNSNPQEWLIVPVSNKYFKIIPKSNMTLALNGLPLSVAGVNVSTYSGNSNQKWQIYVGNTQITTASNIEDTATLYLNNTYTGKFLCKMENSLEGMSGYVNSLYYYAQWKVTSLGNNEYTLQSVSDLTSFLGVSNNTLAFSQLIGDSIPSNYRWIIYNGYGGYIIKNKSTSQYIYSLGTTMYLSSTLTSTTIPYNAFVWRRALESQYGSSSSHIFKELRSGFTIDNMSLDVGETVSPNVNEFPEGASWAHASDFTYSTTSNKISINNENGTITGVSIGTATVTASHKVTGISTTFTITVYAGTLDVWIFATGMGVENFVSGSIFGHAWIRVYNNSAHSYELGNYTLDTWETVSIGRWGNAINDDVDGDFVGVWYNREVYEREINLKYQSNTATYITVSKNKVSEIDSFIDSRYSGYDLLTYNCVDFAIGLWNVAVESEYDTISYNVSNVPGVLEDYLQGRFSCIYNVGTLNVDRCGFYNGIEYIEHVF